MTHVKICGLTRWEDVELAVQAGADYIGFVLEPSSPRHVSIEFVQSVVDRLPAARPKLVGVMGPWISGLDLSLFDIVQSMGDAKADEAPKRIRAVHLAPYDVAETIIERHKDDQYLLLDKAKRGMYGGTGETIDWRIAADVVAGLPNTRIFLAGGLGPDNVDQAIKMVKPFAVDASSRLESSPGVKDHDRVKSFLGAAKRIKV